MAEKPKHLIKPKTDDEGQTFENRLDNALAGKNKNKSLKIPDSLGTGRLEQPLKPSNSSTLPCPEGITSMSIFPDKS